MQLAEFEELLQAAALPPRLPPLLQALWYERRGDWTRAHDITQDIDGEDAARVHAYLHRREGDQGNAAYWYRRAACPVVLGDLDEEWRALVQLMLARNSV